MKIAYGPADLSKESKTKTVQQFIRGIHPLCWLLLLYLIISWVINLYPLVIYGPSWGETSAWNSITSLLISSPIAVVHIGIYEAAFRVRLSKHIQWLVLTTQVALIFVLIQYSHDPQVVVALSLALFVAFLEVLKRPVPILLGSFGYLGCLLLFLQIPAVHAVWIFFLQGENAWYEMLEILICVGLLLYLQQQRSHKRTQALLQELHAAHAQLSAYALRVEELTVFTERQRLARELHDTLTQGVAGLVMQLEAASTYFGKGQSKHAHEIVLSATTRARTVLTETRYVLQDLRADSPRPDDLPEMVQEEIERFTISTGISCVSEIDALARTPDTYCGHVLRTVSEGLSNIARHAQAQHASVRAISHGQHLDIEVSDDGVGFDPEAIVALPGHYGLVGLRERVNLIGGEFVIKSLPGQGTRIRVCVPTGESRICA